MKTITLAVEGVADSQAETNEAIDIEIKGKTDAVESASRALVEALQEAGISVKSASLTIAPRQGTHEVPVTIDLTVEPAAPLPESVPPEGSAPKPEAEG